MPYYGRRRTSGAPSRTRRPLRRNFRRSPRRSRMTWTTTSFPVVPETLFEVPFSTRAISYWRASELIGFTLSVRAISEEPGDISLGATQGDQDESILISGLVTPLKAFSQRYVFRYPARPSAWFSQNLYGVLGTQPFFGPFRGQSSVAAQVVVSIGLRFRAIRTAR